MPKRKSKDASKSLSKRLKSTPSEELSLAELGEQLLFEILHRSPAGYFLRYIGKYRRFRYRVSRMCSNNNSVSE